MKNYFSIGEAAKIAHMTSETLRHYDRIGLVKPSMKDEWTNYRYYTAQDIVRLQSVHALQQMDLPLQKIKEVLGYNDLQKIVEFLSEAEKKADEKIAALQYGKAKIQLAKESYEKKLNTKFQTTDTYIKYFPQRVIMLSDTLETPTLENLWSYLRHFYAQIPSSVREQFAFEDLAGIYSEKDFSRLFAICTHYPDTSGLKLLPAGNYLCADCSEADRQSALNRLQQTVKKEYDFEPEFTVQQVILSGILQWNYQLQVYTGS